MTEELHHLVGAYALDALDAGERDAFEHHLAVCGTCRSDLAEFDATATALAEAAQSTPPPHLKARIMAEVATTRQVPPIVPDRVVDLAERRRRGAPRPRLLAALAAAVVFIAGVAGVATIVADTSDTRTELAEADDAVVTRLSPQDATLGSLRVVWSPERDQANVIGSGLASPGPDQVYALWLTMDDGTVAPAGLFSPTDGEVDAILDLDDLDGSGWAVTIEPASGSDQPTMPPIYAGTA